jgi:hypothetical protein
MATRYAFAMLRRFILCVLGFVCAACSLLHAQTASAPAAAAAQIVATGWPNGSVELRSGWRTQTGDDLAWAKRGFDDSAWPAVTLTPASDSAGWRWYRLSANIPASETPLALLVTGGAGTYEVYVNGQLMPSTRLRPDWFITYPRTQVIVLPAVSGKAVIALRTYIPATSMFLADRGSFRVDLGTLTAIRDAHRAEVSARFNQVAASLAISLLLLFTGAPLLFLFWYQPDHREYLWLGCFLLTDAVIAPFHLLSTHGFAPFSLNWLMADPANYLNTFFQIEFTFSFVGQRVTRGWRFYQALLIGYPACFLIPAWLGWLSRGTFNIGEILVLTPAAFLLPLLLFNWYRRGNGEAGWLILPSLLPLFTLSILDAGLVGAEFDLPRLAAFGKVFYIGPFVIEFFEVGDLLLLLAIAIVMFFRFTRVSREQAQSAAELQAAREIQQYLIPEKLPPTPGLAIESVYQPAREVGGDFFQVLPDARDGSTLIVVGDVAGKGLKAGMLSALIVGAIRTAFKFTSEPEKILALLNERLQGRGLVTCLAIRIDCEGNSELANAGHLPPYVNGKELAMDGALPLGALLDIAFPITRIQLNAGDSILLVSDGVVEARNATGELFGFERTAAISDRPAEIIAHTAQDFGQEDDITVLTLRLLPKATNGEKAAEFAAIQEAVKP